MLSQKSKSNLRIILSGVSLALFAAYTLFDLFAFSKYPSSETYGFRADVLNYLILSVPFIALFVFSILERKLKHISGRVYVVGIFALYFVQFLITVFIDNIFNHSIFCNKIIGTWLEITSVVVGLRLFMLVLVPIANKVLLKIYSVLAIAFFCFILFVAIFSDDYVQLHLPQVIGSVVVDIAFHLALYFFSDLMTSDNESDIWFNFIGVLTYPIFGNPFKDDEEETD